jgi:dTDP-4-dehydrorhamnose 3,5-epimerase-like enzyme
VYNPNYERGISLKDPFLNIDWRIEAENRIISQKDLKHPKFNKAENNF